MMRVNKPGLERIGRLDFLEVSQMVPLRTILLNTVTEHAQWYAMCPASGHRTSRSHTG
jgi:hypothetical protein